MKNAASLLIFVCANAALALAGDFDDFKTKIITTSRFPSGFSIDVPDHYFLRIQHVDESGDGGRCIFMLSWNWRLSAAYLAWGSTYG